ncbi:MAG: GNAT family N-acetyltransferase [Bacteroidota bacterium]
MDRSTLVRWNTFTIREATFADLDTVLHHRRSMFLDMGIKDESALIAMMKTSKPFFADRLKDGRYRAWLVENSSHQVVAGSGIIIVDYHSSPADPTPRRPIIVNVYTESAYRRKGIARQLMKIMIDWCKKEGFGSVLLHASDEGRPLYEQLGFKQTNEMRLMLR